MLKELKESPKLVELKANYPVTNAVIIVCAIIMLWRGVWGLLDTYLFPGMPTLSHIISLALGCVILYLDGFRLDNLKSQ